MLTLFHSCAFKFYFKLNKQAGKHNKNEWVDRLLWKGIKFWKNCKEISARRICFYCNLFILLLILVVHYLQASWKHSCVQIHSSHLQSSTWLRHLRQQGSNLVGTPQAESRVVTQDVIKTTKNLSLTVLRMVPGLFVGENATPLWMQIVIHSFHSK